MALTYAVLIPSRGRATVLRRLFEKHPFLIEPSTYVGVEWTEHDEYRQVNPDLFGPKRVTLVPYENDLHSCGRAREQLRQAAMRRRNPAYDYFVTGDDNMALDSEETLNNLVLCSHEWQSRGLTLVSGLSRFKKYFDRNRKKPDLRVDNGFTTFEGVGMILMCIPRTFYRNYSYPDGMFACEDRHLILSAMRAGATHFRICEDAIFDKRRHQKGGQGSAERRQFNQGMGFAKLANDFPYVMGQSAAGRPMRWTAVHRAFTSDTTGMFARATHPLQIG